MEAQVISVALPLAGNVALGMSLQFLMSLFPACEMQVVILTSLINFEMYGRKMPNKMGLI